jgi:AbrB family looped-hinge helix DNA binding protein
MERKTVKIDDDGGVVIPAEFRDALGLKAGDAVIFTLDGGDLGMYTLKRAVKRIQETVRKYVPEGVSLSDELIEERRAAAAAVEGVIAARKAREAARE